MHPKRTNTLPPTLALIGHSSLVLGHSGAPRRSFFQLDILVPVPRAAGAEPAGDETIDVSVEHGLRIAGAHAGAKILHHLVRLQNIAADLAAKADFTLLA